MANKGNDTALYLFHQGNNYRAYRYLGCHMSLRSGKYRYTFRVWAPNARSVSLISDFCGWENGPAFTRISDNGVWELVYKSDFSLHKQPYKYRITTASGEVLHKGDPYAFFSRGLDDGASLVWDGDPYTWHDDAWMAYRKKYVSQSPDGHYLPHPLNIYEVHLPSFSRHDDGSFLTYRELADTLAPYLKRMGYTHIEILPITEYPYIASWGYQVCGYFAPTSRMGTPDDFRCFVDTLHAAGIGVIMDWVPAHFPKDAWGLYEFDGTRLYEYQGVDRMESATWGTRFFDVAREEVRSFLISSAAFWIEEYHLDGLRVDAVASMLYLDFDRRPGEWIPNVRGGRENLEAIDFLKRLNQFVLSEHPDALMIAEESTDFPMVTGPVSTGGLGFSLKWNMGWANDLFAYLSGDPLYRRYHQSALNFPIVYAFGENYVLPVSHDEVVYGKRSLLNKMFGTYEQKFLQFRVAMLLLMTFPGKKMIFMGTEFGQFSEWDYQKGIEWFMLDFEAHRNLRHYVMALNHFYLAHSQLWEIDFDPEGFQWIYADTADQNMIVFRRFDERRRQLIIALTFSGAPVTDIRIPLAEGERAELVFESTVGCSSGSSDAIGLPDGSTGFIARLDPFSGAVWEVSRPDEYRIVFDPPTH